MAYTVLSNNAWLLQHAQQLQCELQQERHQRLGMQEQLQATCTAWRTLHAQLWQENEGLKLVNSCQMQQLYHAKQQLEDCSMQCHQLQIWLIQMGQHHWQDACQEMEPWRHAEEPLAAEGVPPTPATSPSSGAASANGTRLLPVQDKEAAERWHVDSRAPQHSEDPTALPRLHAAADADDNPCIQLESSRSPSSVPENDSPPPDRADAACQTETDGEDCSADWSVPEISTRSQSAVAAPEGVQVGMGECTPHDLHVPNLLPYLSVQELLSWRLVSCRTRSPEALIEHLKEMGSMERPESVVAYAKMADEIASRPETSFTEAFGGDAEQQKFHECRRWCMALASQKTTHFAESQVRRLVEQNVESLLRHCRSADESVAGPASIVMANYSPDALTFVQRTVADAMLALLEDLVEADIRTNGRRIASCVQTLAFALRSMCKRQRQKWVSLLVKLLMNRHSLKDPLIHRLKMLWAVEDNPKQTYAEAIQHLQTHVKSTSGDLQRDMKFLIHHSCS
ncbi:PAO3 [Symbiodinium sp. CCMP2592]|nr:PAO3 [Symbiodinium sp. CCMP2592]